MLLYKISKDDNQVRETQEKQRQMQLIVDAMTDEEIDEYKSHSDNMKQIVAGTRERVG